MVFDAIQENPGSDSGSQPEAADSIESVALAGSEVLFRVCWGDHAGTCAVGPHGSEGGHDPVAEIDYDSADHRRVLRWLRKLDPAHAHPLAVPHPETLVRRPCPGVSGLDQSIDMEDKR
jgi:hypothetical protein